MEDCEAGSASNAGPWRQLRQATPPRSHVLFSSCGEFNFLAYNQAPRSRDVALEMSFLLYIKLYYDFVNLVTFAKNCIEIQDVRQRKRCSESPLFMVR